MLSLVSIIALKCAPMTAPDDCQFFVDECVNVMKWEIPDLEEELVVEECVDAYAEEEFYYDGQ